MTAAISIALICGLSSFGIGYHFGNLRGRLDATRQVLVLIKSRSAQVELLPEAERAVVRAERRLIDSMRGRA